MMGAMAATFLTALVEWVEAYTIVLAVALSIGWPRALGAVGAALLVLAALTSGGSFILTLIGDLSVLQFVIGLLLTLFGVRWLGKAIARGAGLRRLHDETAAFAGLRARAELREARAAWWIAFNGMLLEGLEVWLIVVALGVQTHHTLAAGAAALGALLMVGAAGAVLRAPLSKVPENTIKFIVGAGILSFGTFWTLESLGYRWPLGDAALPALLAFYALGGLCAIRLLRPKPLGAGAA
jgi:uncharacterized membrane protein